MNKRQFSLAIIATLIFLFIAALLVTVGRTPETTTDEAEDTQQQPEATSVPEVTQASEPDFDLSARNIIYVSNNALWLTDLDGNEPIKLTSDAEEVSYNSPAWKSENVASAVRCAQSCSIEVFDLQKELQEPVYTADNSSVIEAAGWSHDGTRLIVLENDTTGTRRFYQVLPTKKLLKTYQSGPGRGIDPQDQVSIEFSSDDSVVALINTYSGDKETIALHRPDGSEIKTINGDGDRLPAFPAFKDNSTLYYRFGPSLREVPINSQTGIYGIAIEQPFTGTNLALSGNGLYIAYWDVSDQAIPYTGLYNTAEQSTVKLADSIAYARWIDSDSLLATQLSLRQGTDFFQPGGLVIVDRASGATSLLIDAVVTSFSLE